MLTSNIIYISLSNSALRVEFQGEDDDKFKKTPEEMFAMKMQLKYGSPLVTECFAWGHKTEYVTTMRPAGA